MKTQHKKFKTVDIVETGLMAAVIYLATQFFNIPFPLGGTKSMIHLGTAVLFIVVLLIGKNKGALAAAVGLSLYDFLSPYAVFAPFTFVVKGGMAYIAGLIAFRNGYNGNNIPNNLLAFTAGGLFNIVGYFLTDALVYRSFIMAWAHVPSSVITTIIGVVVAVPLGKALKRAMRR